jgi:hypothetical protein
MSDNDCQGEGPEFVERAGRDKLKEKIAWALRKRNQKPPYNAATQWHDLAEAALTAIEDAGIDLMCQVSAGAKGDTVSAPMEPLQSNAGGEAAEPKVDFSFIILNILRGYGWSVAVHNDYRLHGKFHTFWLLTHSSGRWVKGEGESDEIALTQALRLSEERSDTCSPASAEVSLTPNNQEADFPAVDPVTEKEEDAAEATQLAEKTGGRDG